MSTESPIILSAMQPSSWVASSSPVHVAVELLQCDATIPIIARFWAGLRGS